MKILVTLTYYHPHWTGLTVIAQHLAEGLAARGHAVTVLASQHDQDLPRREEVNGVEVIRVPSLGRVSRTAIMPSYPATLARLTAGSEIVHLHTPMPEAALVVGQARLLRRPTLITHQGDVVMPAGATNRVIQRAMDTSLGLAMRLSDGVTVHAADYARPSSFLAPFAHRIQGIYPPRGPPCPAVRRRAVMASSAGAGGQASHRVRRPVRGGEGVRFPPRGHAARPQPPAGGALRVRRRHRHRLRALLPERCRHLVETQSGALTRLGLLRDRQQMADFYAMCDVFVLPVPVRLLCGGAGGSAPQRHTAREYRHPWRPRGRARDRGGGGWSRPAIPSPWRMGSLRSSPTHRRTGRRLERCERCSTPSAPWVPTRS